MICNCPFNILFFAVTMKILFVLNVTLSAWLNNCVGHLNHRYFFSFLVSLALGCIYCSISGRNLFLDAYNAIEVRRSASHTPHYFLCAFLVFYPSKACYVVSVTFPPCLVSFSVGLNSSLLTPPCFCL